MVVAEQCEISTLGQINFYAEVCEKVERIKTQFPLIFSIRLEKILCQQIIARKKHLEQSYRELLLASKLCNNNHLNFHRHSLSGCFQMWQK